MLPNGAACHGTAGGSCLSFENRRGVLLPAHEEALFMGFSLRFLLLIPTVTWTTATRDVLESKLPKL